MKVFRYQPVPEIGSAPVCGFCWGSKGPAIAQSWGKRNASHEESSKAGFSAPTASPLKNRHPWLKLTGRWPETSTGVGVSATPGVAINKKERQTAVTNERQRLLFEISDVPIMDAPVMDAPLRLCRLLFDAVYCLHHRRFLVIPLREDWRSSSPEAFRPVAARDRGNRLPYPILPHLGDPYLGGIHPSVIHPLVIEKRSRLFCLRQARACPFRRGTWTLP